MSEIQRRQRMRHRIVDGLLSTDARLAVTLSRRRELIVWNVQTQQAIYRWRRRIIC